METFGEYLRAHREKKGIRLEEIASITKIHLHNLELLEANQWTELPPDPFLRGFISAYAKYVGLEPKEVLGRFYAEIGRTPADVQATPLVPADGSSGLPAENPSKLIEQAKDVASGKILIAAGLAVVTLLTAGIIYIGRKGTPSPETAGEVAQANTEAATAGDGHADAPKRAGMPGVEAVTKSLAQGAGKGPSDGTSAPASPATATAANASSTASSDKKAVTPKEDAKTADERKVASPTGHDKEKTSAKAAPEPAKETKVATKEAPKDAPKEAPKDAKETTKDAKVSAKDLMALEKVASPNKIVAISNDGKMPATLETKMSTDGKASPLGAEAKSATADAKAAGAAPSENVIGDVPKEQAKHEVAVEGLHRTWIKYVIDDKAPVQSFLKENEKITFRAKDRIKIVLGNSPGSKVVHNGQEEKGVKFEGTIRIYKFPSNARFPQDKAGKRAAASRAGDAAGAPAETSAGESAATEATPDTKAQ